MKIFNTVYKTSPVAIHRPGRNWHNESCECSSNCKFWKKINRIFFKKKFIYKKTDVTFVTWNNTGKKQLLEKCFEQLDINYVCLGKNIKKWENVNKITTLYNYIKKIKSKYIFGLDSFDVMFLGNTEEAINKFENLRCEMIFNSTVKNFPEYSDESIEKKIAPKNTKFIYLNAGCWLAKTEFIVEIIQKLNRYVNESNEKSEQFFMKKIFIEYNNHIKIDYYMEIFQSGLFNQIKYSGKSFL